MAKKLCLTLIVFFIDFIYAGKIFFFQNNGTESVNNNYAPLQALDCQLNEVLISDRTFCEPICNLPSSIQQCLQKTAPSCICSIGYIRNDFNKCIPLNECSQKQFNDSISRVESTVNVTQSTSLYKNEIETSHDDETLVPNMLEKLKRSLDLFLKSLQSRMQTSSSRNVRNTDQNHQNSYRDYESLLRASSEASEPE